jgi:HAD superfamily hydrolase (TIGR01509 family)
MTPELVIFDCDGVLIDSERLAVRVEGEILARLGWPLSREEIIERFVGRSSAYMRAEIEAQIGRPVNWAEEFQRHYDAVYEIELQVVPGIDAVLDGLTVPTCVASSSTHRSLRRNLGLVGLFERFEGRIFSAEDVVHGKPAPDLFLYAARQMGVAPERCVVVEDAPAGVTGARAAGMTVLGFTDGLHGEAPLLAAGAIPFARMSDLLNLLGALSSADEL